MRTSQEHLVWARPSFADPKGSPKTWGISSRAARRRAAGVKTPEREPPPASTAPPFPYTVLCNRDLGFVPAAGRPLSMAKPPLPRTHSQEGTPQLSWTSILSSPLCLEQLYNQSTVVWRMLFIGLLRDIVLCAIGLGAITTINYNSHGGPVLKDRGPL